MFFFKYAKYLQNRIYIYFKLIYNKITHMILVIIKNIIS